MKKTYIIIALVAIIILLIISINSYLKGKEHYTNITDATHDEISKVINEKLSDSIISAIVADEGKKIECSDGVLFFLKLEVNKDKLDDIKKALNDRVKEDGEKKTQAHFGIEYVEEINNGDVKAHYTILSGGSHGESLIEEMWIVEIGENTYLYYYG